MTSTTARLIAAACLIGAAQSALAQDCQVLDQFPVEIREPDRYCLDGAHLLKLCSGESSVRVNPSHMEVDLRGFTLVGRNDDQPCRNELTEPSTTGVVVCDDRRIPAVRLPIDSLSRQLGGGREHPYVGFGTGLGNNHRSR